jgi:predicted dehydrogenase
MQDLRIGVIGSGGRGSLARYAHRPGDGSRVVACCDVNEAAFERNRDWYGDDVALTTDYRELLAQDLDAVFVTTPDFLHEEHAVAALEAGKAVYLEKPMAITIAGCDRILRTAKEREGTLYVGHNMRHFAVILKMKELIDGGAVGEVKTAWCRHFVSYGGDAYYKDWHADRTKTTGLLLQKGAHDIDVLHWLCGGYAERVTAMGALTLYDQIADRHDASERGNPRFVQDHWPPLTQTGLNPVLDVEDVSMVLMRLDNGVLASYQQCHYTPDAWRNYTVIGTEGRIENFARPSGCGTSAATAMSKRGTRRFVSRTSRAGTAVGIRASSPSSCATCARAGRSRPLPSPRATASPPGAWPPSRCATDRCRWRCLNWMKT